jgi:hypothetical protein
MNLVWHDKDEQPDQTFLYALVAIRVTLIHGRDSIEYITGVYKRHSDGRDTWSVETWSLPLDTYGDFFIPKDRIVAWAELPDFNPAWIAPSEVSL